MKKIIILAAVSFLLIGCLAAQKKAAPVSLEKQTEPVEKEVVVKAIEPDNTAIQQPKRMITEDVLVFNDLKQIDLDKDGFEEIIAVYTAGVNSSGAKVIKFNKDKGAEVIFEKKFGTAKVEFGQPDIKVEIREGVPVILVNEEIYSWDGKTFALELK